MSGRPSRAVELQGLVRLALRRGHRLRAEFTMIPDLEGRRAVPAPSSCARLARLARSVGQFYLVRGYRKDLSGLLSAGVSVYWSVGRSK